MNYRRPLYQVIASTVDAYHRCVKTGNAEWEAKHRDMLRDLESSFLPSGSGIDSGCKIRVDESSANKVVIDLGFHHMNDGGGYDGWTEHRATIRPSLIHGIDIRFSGPNRNDIKEYLHETLAYALNLQMENDNENRRYVVAREDSK